VVGAVAGHSHQKGVAETADLRVGDVITHFGTISAPTPAQVRMLAAAAPLGHSLLVAVTRDGAYHLTVITP